MVTSAVNYNIYNFKKLIRSKTNKCVGSLHYWLDNLWVLKPSICTWVIFTHNCINRNSFLIIGFREIKSDIFDVMKMVKKNGYLTQNLLLLYLFISLHVLPTTFDLCLFPKDSNTRGRIMKSYNKSRQHIKKQIRHCAYKGLHSQIYGFTVVMYGCWELDRKEDWVPKNWCFWTVVLEKTLENPLDCKEIKSVIPKGNQSWIFPGRTDAEAETPILWPPDAKSWLKDPDPGKD